MYDVQQLVVVSSQARTIPLPNHLLYEIIWT
jgi:hypothetical protein